jgi:hypothetical protein
MSQCHLVSVPDWEAIVGAIGLLLEGALVVITFKYLKATQRIRESSIDQAKASYDQASASHYLAGYYFEGDRRQREATATHLLEELRKVQDTVGWARQEWSDMNPAGILESIKTPKAFEDGGRLCRQFRDLPLSPHCHQHLERIADNIEEINGSLNTLRAAPQTQYFDILNVLRLAVCRLLNEIVATIAHVNDEIARLKGQAVTLDPPESLSHHPDTSRE